MGDLTKMEILSLSKYLIRSFFKWNNRNTSEIIMKILSSKIWIQFMQNNLDWMFVRKEGFEFMTYEGIIGATGGHNSMIERPPCSDKPPKV